MVKKLHARQNISGSSSELHKIFFLRYTWPLVPVISPGTKGSRFQNRDERGDLEPGQKLVSVVVSQTTHSKLLIAFYIDMA